MFTLATAYIAQTGKWLNDNQGIVTVAIFILTIVLGWVSGIFSALRRQPKFRISLLDGPTFCCTFPVGKQQDGHEVHRTGIALYLTIANVGSAASSICNISVGYHWQLVPFSYQWFRYSCGWFWLRNQAAALSDFQVAIGSHTKVFPFLMQKGFLSPSTRTFLRTGQSTSGVVYFEQSDSWGGCFPRSRNGETWIKVCVEDVFQQKHTAKFRIQIVSMEHARKYNPSFGSTLAELHGEVLPIDANNS